MSSTLRSIMARVPHAAIPKPRLVKRSTAEYWRDHNTRVIRLHQTDILTFHFGNGLGKDTIEIHTGGWLTMTTRNRINEFLPGFQVHGGRGPWYIMPRIASSHSLVNYTQASVLLTEGFTIIDGELPADAPRPLAQPALDAAIRHFALYCDQISFVPPSAAGSRLTGLNDLINNLLTGGHAWQTGGGYEPILLHHVLTHCFPGQDTIQVEAARKLGSNVGWPKLRKAVRDYLTKLIASEGAQL